MQHPIDLQQYYYMTNRLSHYPNNPHHLHEDASLFVVVAYLLVRAKWAERKETSLSFPSRGRTENRHLLVSTRVRTTQQQHSNWQMSTCQRNVAKQSNAYKSLVGRHQKHAQLGGPAPTHTQQTAAVSLCYRSAPEPKSQLSAVVLHIHLQ